MKQPTKDVKESGEPVLSKKESNELKPKLKEALSFVFKNADKGLSGLSKTKAKASIWSTVTDEEIDVIANKLLETGQRVPIIAMASRRIARDFTNYQIGIIMLPRLIMSGHFLMENGLFFMGEKNVQNKISKTNNVL